VVVSTARRVSTQWRSRSPAVDSDSLASSACSRDRKRRSCTLKGDKDAEVLLRIRTRWTPPQSAIREHRAHHVEERNVSGGSPWFVFRRGARATGRPVLRSGAPLQLQTTNHNYSFPAAIDSVNDPPPSPFLSPSSPFAAVESPRRCPLGGRGRRPSRTGLSWRSR